MRYAGQAKLEKDHSLCAKRIAAMTTKMSTPPFPRPGFSPAIAHLHHVDNSISVLHVVLRLTNLHAHGAGEALAALQNVEPSTRAVGSKCIVRGHKFHLLTGNDSVGPRIRNNQMRT